MCVRDKGECEERFSFDLFAVAIEFGHVAQIESRFSSIVFLQLTVTSMFEGIIHRLDKNSSLIERDADPGPAQLRFDTDTLQIRTRSELV